MMAIMYDANFFDYIQFKLCINNTNPQIQSTIHISKTRQTNNKNQ